MDKNTLIVLGFLLLCILLSLDKKEGFVTINIDDFEAQCGAGHECIVTQSGSRGFICGENADSDNYNINGGGDGVTIFSDPFTLSLDAAEPCNSTNAEPDPIEPPFISPCTTSGDPYRLSGCISKCTKPVSSDIYNLDRAPLKIGNSPEPIQNQEITCNSGFVPAANICFDKNTGDINPNKNQGNCSGPDNIWYDAAQGVKIYCPSPGEDYVIMGCEPSCLSRISHSDDYLISDLANLPGDYDMGKELMQITPERNEEGSGTVMIINSSPYNVNEDNTSLDPNNFNVQITPSNATTDTGISIPFEGTGTSEACNINSDNMDTKDKYYVSGLFPTCSDNEECLNFNISYNEGETKPYNLEDLRNQLPTNIFQGNPSEDDIRKYRDSLYYFRGFKDSDGNYNVEGQIRCNIDQNSRYGCAIVDNNRYCETLQPIGDGQHGGVDGCNGPNRTKKNAQEISQISNEELREAIASDEDGTNIGDTNFQSPCCKWTGLAIPDGLVTAGDPPDINEFLTTPSNMCSIAGNGDSTEINYAGMISNRQCGGYSVEYTDAFGEQGSINFIHNYRATDANCNNYNSDNRSCWCPQNSDGSFWNVRVWGAGAEGVSRNARTGAGWGDSTREGIIVCDQQTP